MEIKEIFSYLAFIWLLKEPWDENKNKRSIFKKTDLIVYYLISRLRCTDIRIKDYRIKCYNRDLKRRQMADSNNDAVRRRSRRSTSNVTDNDAPTTESDDLGRFAHRLSLDVTHDALTLASHNGGISTATASQIERVEEPPTASSSSERPQSLPNTPGGSGTRLAEAPSYDECRKHHQKTPVGKIRDVSRTLAKWLRFKSKSINGLNDRGEGVHVDPPWRPWRKSTKTARQDLCKRALPPVPVGGGASVAASGESTLPVNDESEVSQPQQRSELYRFWVVNRLYNNKIRYLSVDCFKEKPTSFYIPN